MKDRLLYECDTMRAKLDYEITATERQLDSVNKRLAGLYHDIYIYLGFIFVPLIIIVFLGFLPYQSSLIGSVLHIIQTILLCLIGMGTPFNIYHLAKACMLLYINNKESSNPLDKQPLLEGTLPKGRQPKQEATYRLEYDKLVYILSRYYINVETLNGIEKEINAENCTMTMASLKVKLMQIPFYEEIHPADAFTSPMAKKAQRFGWITLGITILPVICLILICLANS